MVFLDEDFCGGVDSSVVEAVDFTSENKNQKVKLSSVMKDVKAC